MEDFHRGDRHFKHVPPSTYLIYLSRKELDVLGLFKSYNYLTMKYNAYYEIWTLFAIVYCARRSILYPFGHRALWSMVDYWGVLQRIGLHPTIIVKENLLLKRFEPFSPQANPVECCIFYPFSYRTTPSVLKKNINKWI